MKNFLKSTWKFLNGNKSIITSSICTLLQLDVVKNNMNPDVHSISVWAFGTMAALSIGHHAYKGYFSTKVGNTGQEIKNNDIPKTIQELKNIFLKSKK